MTYIILAYLDSLYRQHFLSQQADRKKGVTLSWSKYGVGKSWQYARQLAGWEPEHKFHS